MMRSRLAVVLLLVPYGASISCSSKETAPFTVETSYAAGTIALGEDAFVTVFAEDERRDGEGPGGTVSCVSEVMPSVILERASCEPDCLTSIDGQAVRVTTTSPGEKTVKITYRLVTQEGEEASETTASLRFARAAGIRVSRWGDASPSGTAFAMVAGERQSWSASVIDEAGAPLFVDVSKIGLAMDGAGLLDAARPREEGSPRYDHLTPLALVNVPKLFGGITTNLTANAPGILGVTWTYPGLSRRDSVRAIDLGDARRVELRQLQVLDQPDAIELPPALEAVSPPLVLWQLCTQFDNVNLVVPRIETADGTVALGAGWRLRAEPETVMSVTREDQLGRFGIFRNGDGRIFGDFGPVSVSVPYTVKAGCPSPWDGGPNDAGPPDAGEPDAGTDGGAADSG